MADVRKDRKVKENYLMKLLIDVKNMTKIIYQNDKS